MSPVTDDRADFFAGRGPNARWIGSIRKAPFPAELRSLHSLADGDPDAANDGNPYVVTDFMDEVEELLVEFEDGPTYVNGGVQPPRTEGTVWSYCFDAGAVYVHQDGYLIEVLYPNGSRKRAELPDVTKESNGAQPAAG